MTQDEQKTQIFRQAHGLAPISRSNWEQRRADFEEILSSLNSRTTPEWTQDLSDALRRTSSLFGSISRQASPDWFAMSRLLHHPSPRLCRRIVSGVKRLNDALECDSIVAINEALEQLESAYLPHMLEEYLAVTRPLNPAHPSEPTNWIYVFTSPQHPALLQVGRTDGTLDRAIAAANRTAASHEGVGVAAAWRVTDLDAAYATVTAEVGFRHVRDGLHSFTEWQEFTEARHQIDIALENRKIVVGNPFWTPSAPTAILADPFSSILRNRNFEVDVDEVFAAFKM